MDFDSLIQEAESVQSGLQKAPAAPARAMQPPQELSGMDKLLAKIPTGLVNNPAVAGVRNIVTRAAAPIYGATQLIANMMPDSTGVPQLYNRKVGEVEAKDRAAQAEQPPIGAAVNELAGNVISPANLAMAVRATPAVTAGQRAVQGGTIGTVAGATAPVEVGDSGKYWGQKAAQTLVAGTAGAVLAPLVGAIGDRVLARINAKNFNPGSAAKDADDIINGALAESNQKLEDIPPDQLSKLRSQTVDALSSGKRLDAAAALRMQDFNAEGIQGTQGQVTRDPMQFADEQTMKAMSRPLSQTLEAGNKKVMRGITQYGVNAQEGPVASAQLADALRNYDAGQQRNVSTAYATARASAGKDLEVPTAGLQDAYKQVFRTYRGNVPDAVQAEFEGLGKQPFTFEAADDLRKIINANMTSDSRSPTNAALNTLRSALNNAQTATVAGGGPFAPAVKLASQRFAEHEAIPALGAAASNNAGDNFVQQHVINGQTGDVQKLAALLRSNSPEAFQEVRQQIGSELSRKAFGENVAADKAIAQESYNKALRTLGTGKLEAFFEPDEVEQLKRLGRIASYQQSNPAAAATNFSNSAGAIANLLRAGGGIPMAGKTLQTAGEKLGGYAAIHPSVPDIANLTPAQRQALSRALLAIGGGGSAAIPRIGQQP